MRIIFAGTAEFAVLSLKILLDNGYDIKAVITVPDKPAGRGLQFKESPVKKFALKHKLNLLQPANLKDDNFVKELKALKPELMVVVAFRILPEVVWKLPRFRTINLHASLLPEYRGAAPINWVIMRGERETGVTTFFIDNEIDKGNIIFQENTKIIENETAGELHDRLMDMGAKLVLKTVKCIESGIYPLIEQLNKTDKKQAPKIYSKDCKINWKKNIHEVHNFICGLCPFPTPWTIINGKKLKIFKVSKECILHSDKTGLIVSDNKTYLNITVEGGFINLLEVQLEGRKRMNVKDFLRGVTIKDKTIGK